MPGLETVQRLGETRKHQSSAESVLYLFFKRIKKCGKIQMLEILEIVNHHNNPCQWNLVEEDNVVVYD